MKTDDYLLTIQSKDIKVAKRKQPNWLGVIVTLVMLLCGKFRKIKS
jgi:hypothetical protein